jgi:hypothetical protein
MWGAIASGLGKAAKFVGGNIKNATLGSVIGDNQGWFSPIGQLIKFIKNRKKPAAGGTGTTGGGGLDPNIINQREAEQDKNLPAPPASPASTAPAGDERREGGFSVSFAEPQSSTAAPMQNDNMGMLQLHPYKMNRRRRLMQDDGA